MLGFRRTFCSLLGHGKSFPDSVMKICKGFESPRYQPTLYSEFMRNVECSGGTIMMKGLAENYSMIPETVAGCLYLHAIEGRGRDKSINMFNLPARKRVGVVMYDKQSYQAWDKDNELIENYQRDADKMTFSDGINRTLIPGTMSVILDRDDDYDCLDLETTTRDAEGLRELVETWTPGFNETHIQKIIELSAKNNHYINRLGGVVIKNTFNGSHVYNTGDYDVIYGKHGFNRAILWFLCLRLRYIRYMESIKKFKHGFS